MRRITAWLLTVTLLFCVPSVSVAAQTCEGYIYTVSDDGAIIEGVVETFSESALIIPRTLNGYTVVGIAKMAFVEHQFTSVVIPDSVKSIGENAFYKCSALVSLSVGKGLESAEYGAFTYCTALRSVYITDLASWSSANFSDYANPLSNGADLYVNGELLTELYIPDGVTTVGSRAFDGCRSITSVKMADSVTAMGSYAFGKCVALTSLILSPNIKVIPHGMVDGCESLTSVVIPSGVTEIKLFAFSDCESLVSITIPNTVTTIGGCLCLGSWAFTDIYYHGTPEEWAAIDIGQNNTNLFDATVHYNPTECGHVYDDVCDDTCDLCGDVRRAPHAPVTDEAVPPTCTASGLTEGSHCGVCNTVIVKQQVDPAKGHIPVVASPVDPTCTEEGLTSSTYCHTCGESIYAGSPIPATGHAYDNDCDPACNTCGDVRDTDHIHDNDCDTTCNRCGAKRDATHLYDNGADAVCNRCGAWRFYTFVVADGQASITAVNPAIEGEVFVPEKYNGFPVTSIAEDAFSQCTAITRLHVGEGVTIIGGYAFSGCRAMQAVSLPSTLQTVGEGAFRGCAALEAVVLPSGVTTVGAFAFMLCESMVSVTLGENLVAVGDGAFFDCVALCDVWYGGTSRAEMTIGTNNDPLLAAVWHYTATGDVDENGCVDSTDARLVLQYAVGKVDAHALHVTAADADGNGTVDSTDARLILQYAVGKIATFPNI